MDGVSNLPQLVMGPMVRRADAGRVCFQFVTTRPCHYRIEFSGVETFSSLESIQLGQHLYLNFINVIPVSGQFAVDSLIYYSLHDEEKSLDLSSYCYERAESPAFVIPNRL
ncbi:MAG: metallophosphatase, partial [Pseudoalteromonadaceae bacterium]|nr:metallophosphatase [Pseudoalteromonadaceae bacterium]